MSFNHFITDAPLWLTIPLGLIYLTLWGAFLVLMVRLWRSRRR